MEPEHDAEWLQAWKLPEQAHEHGARASRCEGDRRWLSSSNVVSLEGYRRKRIEQARGWYQTFR